MKFKNNEELSSNMEDYLEAITVLKRTNGVARVRDIGRSLKVKIPSVTSALNTLSKKRLVVHEKYGYVELTAEGEKIAERLYYCHDMLVRFLTGILKINSKIAQIDACRMEHAVSSKTFEKLTKFIEFVEGCPETGRPDWLRNFDFYFKTGKRRKCNIRQVRKKKEK